MPAETIRIENRLSELQRVEAWLAALLDRWQVSAEPRFAVDLVINEAVTNVISYAYPDDAIHEIRVSLRDQEESILVEIVDDGGAFDPFHARPASPARSLADAEVSGRGVLLIKSFAEAYAYKRVGNRNHLVLSVRKKRTGGEPAHSN